MRSATRMLLGFFCLVGVFVEPAYAVKVSDIIRKVRCPDRVSANGSLRETYTAATKEKCKNSPELVMVEDREFGITITMARGVATMSVNGAIVIDGAVDVEHVLEGARCGVIDFDNTVLLLWDPLIKKQGCDEGTVPKNRVYRQFHLVTEQLCWGGTSLCVSRLDLKGKALERFNAVVNQFYPRPSLQEDISQAETPEREPAVVVPVEVENEPVKQKNTFKKLLKKVAAKKEKSRTSNCLPQGQTKYTIGDLEAAKALRARGLDKNNKCAHEIFKQFFPPK